MSTFQKLRLDAINISAGTQSRAETNDDTVKEYKQAIEDGVEFPPVIVFSDGSDGGKWLADGFHRYEAHQDAGLLEISCDVRNGSRRDALLFSVGANASHGLRRTIEDKRRAVSMLLDDAEWSTWSDRDIARQCGVSHSFVAAVRSPVVAARQRENRQQSAVKKYVAVESDSTHETEQGPLSAPPRPAPTTIDTPPASPAAVRSAGSPPVLAVAPHEDIPDLGVSSAGAAPTDASLDQFIDSLDDGHVPDLEDVNRELETMNAALEAEIGALKAEVARLGGTDQAARIEALCLERDEAYSLAASHRSDFVKANKRVVDYEKLLARLRRAAGVEKDSEIRDCIVRRSGAA